MKTLLYTFATALALLVSTAATAQNRGAKVDSVLLSERMDGNYRIRTYRVVSSGDADYEVRYRINVATLNAALADNADNLADLDKMLDALLHDSLVHHGRATIVGYASPDGPAAFNNQLAQRRADDFKAYLDRRYDFSSYFTVSTEADAEDWDQCADSVERSQMPNRARVVEIMDSDRSEMAIEQALRAMPAEWNYLKKNILPLMRRVELTIRYNLDRIVAVRTETAPPAPPAPAPRPVEKRCCTVVDEDITGIIVEIPDHDIRRVHRDMVRETRRQKRVRN